MDTQLCVMVNINYHYEYHALQNIMMPLTCEYICVIVFVKRNFYLQVPS